MLLEKKTKKLLFEIMINVSKITALDKISC